MEFYRFDIGGRQPAIQRLFYPLGVGLKQLLGGHRLLAVWIDRFDQVLTVLFNQLLDLLFRFFQALLTGARELNALLERLKGFFKALLATFHAFDEFFQFRQSGFKVGWGTFLGHDAISWELPQGR
jgi:hypothetical protein